MITSSTATDAHTQSLEAAQAAFDAGQWSAAEEQCRAALRAAPGDARALHLLGRVLQRQGQIAIAQAVLRKAIAIQPDFAPAYASLGAVQIVLCRYDDAQTSLQRAIDLDPLAARPHRLLGMALQDQARHAEAIAAFQRAVDLRPEAAAGYGYLGAAMHAAGDREGALCVLTRARELEPTSADTHVKLGNLLHDVGLTEDAVQCYRTAVDLSSDMPFGHSNLIFSLHYRSTLDRRALRAEAEHWAARYAGPALLDPRPHDIDRDPNRPLRIGYISADFKRHPVGYFLKAVLTAHDRSRVETFCYGNGIRTDDLTRELVEVADHWRTIVAAADAEVAETIRRDKIDILVDLSGHTGGHRLSVFARKPAPVQATWLGYFGTTGVPAIDYILVDDAVCPPGAEDQFTESPVRLPHSYLCYAPPATAPDPAPPPSLVRGYPTFGCFNRLAKIGPDVIALWSEILHAVPTAHLALKDIALDDESGRQRILSAFGKHGIGEDRLDLSGRSSHDQYLSAYADIDVALDPFPFTGATTTVEALWMGVPVVTLAGDRFVSRMGTSLLGGVGLSEYIATSPVDYVRIAVASVSQPDALAAMRTRLRGRVAASPVCDGETFTRNLEEAYRSMWRTWLQSRDRCTSS